MTKIRLARFGSRHQPYYRIVVTDSRSRRDGRFIETLGSFNPTLGEVQLNAERAQYWLSVGAQPTNTTISLLTKGGVSHNLTPRKKPVKPVEAAPAAEEAAEKEVAQESEDSAEVATETEVAETTESTEDAAASTEDAAEATEEAAA